MTMRIFSDLAGPGVALELLRTGTQGHELLFPSKPAVSCLHKTDPDPLMSLADVIVGQPDPEAIGNAPQVKWIQISSSSITRYDYAEFRALVADRGIAVCNSASVYSESCAEHALAF